MSKHLRIHCINVLRTKFFTPPFEQNKIFRLNCHMMYPHMDRRPRGFMCLPGSSLFEFDGILPENIPQTVACANFNENCRVNFPDEFHWTKSCFLVKNFPTVYGFQPYKWSKQFDICHYLELYESIVQAGVATLMLLNSVCTLFSDALFDSLKNFPRVLKNQH